MDEHPQWWSQDRAMMDWGGWARPQGHYDPATTLGQQSACSSLATSPKLLRCTSLIEVRPVGAALLVASPSGSTPTTVPVGISSTVCCLFEFQPDASCRPRVASISSSLGPVCSVVAAPSVAVERAISVGPARWLLARCILSELAER